jgi:polyisoprenoid-binding protein YceI
MQGEIVLSTIHPEEDAMKRLSIMTIALLFLVLGWQSAQATARSWELDKAHTNFYFTVDHIFSKIQGHFNDYSGEVNFDPKNLAESRFFFEIKTASVDTNVAKRDKHLQSADFFDEGKFPLMTFESTKISDAGNGVYNVLGNFTVKGEVHELLLPLTLAGVKGHPAAKGKEVIGFNGRVTIDRLAYKIGMGKFFDMGVVGKEVEIFVSLEALSEK